LPTAVNHGFGAAWNFEHHLFFAHNNGEGVWEVDLDSIVFNTSSATSGGACISTCSKAVCSGGDHDSICRSKWGYCGDTAAHCNAESSWKKCCNPEIAAKEGPTLTGTVKMKRIGKSAKAGSNDGLYCPNAVLPYASCGDKNGPLQAGNASVTDADCGTGYVAVTSASEKVCTKNPCAVGSATAEESAHVSA